MTQEITCSDAIIQSLIERGVDTIFAIPGAQTYAFFDALSRYQDDIKLVVMYRGPGTKHLHWCRPRYAP